MLALTAQSNSLLQTDKPLSVKRHLISPRINKNEIDIAFEYTQDNTHHELIGKAKQQIGNQLDDLFCQNTISFRT